MADRETKREYQRARRLALEELGRRYQDEYAQLMAQHLGRNLNRDRQRAVRSRKDRRGRA